MSRFKLALVLAAALTLPAAEIAAQEEFVGGWEFAIETGRGSFSQTFAFTVEDGALSGTVTSQIGTSDLTDLSYEDGTLTFSITRTFGDNSFTQNFTTSVSGDEMTGTSTIAGGRGGRGGGGGGRGGPREFTATRTSG